MRFLLPVGGVVDHRFGILTTPGHKGVPVGIKAGMDWAADNQAFTGFDPGRFFPWLKTMVPYCSTCLFVPVPDVVGDAAATIENFYRWCSRLCGWSLAFVGQDGQEEIDFPTELKWDTLFIGGSTEWKVSQAAVSVIERAQALGKNIHIGRVNWHKRYKHFRRLAGSEHFTCDGTRTRYDGTEKTVRAWAAYQAQLGLFDSVPGGDSGG